MRSPAQQSHEAEDMFAIPPPVDPRPMARAHDPQTSHNAAARARKFVAPSHCELILGVLWRPMIPPEIGKLTGLTVVQIDRRRVELVRDGLITLGSDRDGYQTWVRVL